MRGDFFIYLFFISALFDLLRTVIYYVFDIPTLSDSDVSPKTITINVTCEKIDEQIMFTSFPTWCGVLFIFQLYFSIKG